MSKKLLLTIIIIFFIIGLGFLGYIYWQENRTDNNDPSYSGGIVNPFGNFFPTENGPVSEQFDSEGNVIFPETTAGPVPKLRQISDEPVAGALVFDRTATSSDLIINDQGVEEPLTFTQTVFRYVDRATGHIYETTSDNLTVEKISNTTIPKVYEAFFLGADTVAFRYLDSRGSIDTFVANILQKPEENQEATLAGEFLNKNIIDFSASVSGEKIFSLIYNSNSQSVSKILGNISTSENPTDTEIIFNHPISEWISKWNNDTTVLLNTKPSAYSAGYLYSLNSNTGSFQKILGPINGLNTSVSPDGNKIIYSESVNNRILTRVYNVEEGSFANLSISPLAEKCVWSQNNIDAYCAYGPTFGSFVYPDYWYMGIASFSDSIYKINTNDFSSTQIYAAGDEIFDVINMSLSPKEDYILFTNKKDLSLWSLDIK